MSGTASLQHFWQGKNDMSSDDLTLSVVSSLSIDSNEGLTSLSHIGCIHFRLMHVCFGFNCVSLERCFKDFGFMHKGFGFVHKGFGFMHKGFGFVYFCTMAWS